MLAAPERFRPADAPILARLRAETRDSHRAIEQNPRLAALVGPGFDRTAYAELLARLLPFHAALDSGIARWLGGHPSLDLGRRCKAPHLRADLAALGVTPPDCPSLPGLVPTSEARAWGALYVVEGASLGGRIILDHLRAVPGLADGAATSFHAGYGHETGRMWRDFRAALAGAAARPHAPVDPAEVVFAARDTFQRLDLLLRAA